MTFEEAQAEYRAAHEECLKYRRWGNWTTWPLVIGNLGFGVSRTWWKEAITPGLSLLGWALAIAALVHLIYYTLPYGRAIKRRSAAFEVVMDLGEKELEARFAQALEGMELTEQ